MIPDEPFVMSTRLYWMKSEHDAMYKDRMRDLLSSIRTGVWSIFVVLVVIAVLVAI